MVDGHPRLTGFCFVHAGIRERLRVTDTIIFFPLIFFFDDDDYNNDVQLGIFSLSLFLFLLFSVKLEIFFVLINGEGCSGSGKHLKQFSRIYCVRRAKS